MNPRVQYAKTSDGVNIAYWEAGAGHPLLYVQGIPFTHIELEIRMPAYVRWHEAISTVARLVRLDIRGCGLSDRKVEGIGLEGAILDIEAVADRLQIGRFALVGVQTGALPAVRYAAENPKRLTHLVLWDAVSSGNDILGIPQMRALAAMIEDDWELFSETVAQYLFGWSGGETTRQFAEYVRQSVDPQGLKAYMEVGSQIDVTADLGRVSQPALVIQNQHTRVPTEQTARRLAAAIPNAQLLLLREPWSDPGDEVGLVTQALGDLLGAPPADHQAPAPGGADVLAVLFTDIEGSTALTRRLGDDRSREVFREHEALVRETLSRHGGSEVKAMGDGFMAVFTSVVQAVRCATDIQQLNAERNTTADVPLNVRIGIDAGEPIAEGRDYFGSTVNMAARIASMAGGGQTLVSEGVRHLVSGKGFLLSDFGEHVLRGFEDPVRLYELSTAQG